MTTTKNILYKITKFIINVTNFFFKFCIVPRLRLTRYVFIINCCDKNESTP